MHLTNLETEEGSRMLRWPYHWRKPEGVKKGIPKLRGLWYKFDCFVENIFIHLCPFPTGGIYEGNARQEIVTVSLTSFPARIDKAYYAVKSLMLQSVKADRILLWLAEEQFPNRALPKKFKKLQCKGLTVCWCDDLKSHKKYYYALKNQKQNELVVTYDDDIIYEYDSLEKLLVAHKKYPKAIVCNRGHEMTVNNAGELAPYNKWKIYSELGVNEPAYRVLPSTGNGCLYPYGVMPDITFNWEMAKNNALTADDIWMRFCSLNNNVKVVKTRAMIATLCNVMGSQRERLTQLNDICGENQKVIERLLKVFPNLFENKSEV